MTRVVVVDDQALLREGFRLILERAGMEVVGEAADGVEAVEVCLATTPDVVLMDVRMPRLDGIEVTRRIVARQPSVRVLALTTFDLDEYVYGAVQAGASGFALKDISPRDLVHAVEVVARGEAMLAPINSGCAYPILAARHARPRPRVLLSAPKPTNSAPYPSTKPPN